MDQELNLNAWILVGNLLNAVMRGPQQVALADGPLRSRLSVLDVTLASVTQQDIVQALRALPGEDRMLLHDLCVACFDRLGDEAETILGLDRLTASTVLVLLQG